MISVTVTVDLRRLKRFREALQRGSRESAVRTMLRQWAARYRGFVQERFDLYSKGGGSWPPLKRKRKRGRLERATILRDTGILFSALNPDFTDKPGAYEEFTPFGVEIGYGGSALHGTDAITVSELAAIHDQGLGRVPKRQIVVPPSDEVVRGMVTDARRMLGRLLEQ